MAEATAKDDNWFIGEDATIYGGDGDEVARILGNLALDVTAMERAERILRAVNAHDKLVEALEALLKAARGDDPDDLIKAYDKGASALARAKGE